MMWLLEFVKSLTGVDVARELVDPFAGRWDRVSAYGEAMTNVAQCLQAVSADVSAISADLAKEWEGRAAGSAQGHLADISTSLHRDCVMMADIGWRYRELAAAMRCGQMAAEVLLKAVLDAAIQVAVCAAAGAATSPTPTGGVIGYGLATYKTAHLVHLVEEWSKLVAVTRAQVEALPGNEGRPGWMGPVVEACLPGPCLA